MLNITGKYITVFQPQIDLNISGKMVFANISSSKKDTRTNPPTYTNMSWKAKFVGEAFESAKALRDKDKIDIVKGVISNTYDKEKGKLYVDVTIFEFLMSDTKKKEDKIAAAAADEEDDDELPF